MVRSVATINIKKKGFALEFLREELKEVTLPMSFRSFGRARAERTLTETVLLAENRGGSKSFQHTASFEA
ncbi:MAG: hypothetical protein LBH62_06830 [Nitrososphaerota archaeon]|jgi:hypothetical protein|nr:hypothetical protein [Nitrososphaerota archaeon]